MVVWRCLTPPVATRRSAVRAGLWRPPIRGSVGEATHGPPNEPSAAVSDYARRAAGRANILPVGGRSHLRRGDILAQEVSSSPSPPRRSDDSPLRITYLPRPGKGGGASKGDRDESGRRSRSPLRRRGAKGGSPRDESAMPEVRAAGSSPIVSQLLAMASAPHPPADTLPVPGHRPTPFPKTVALYAGEANVGHGDHVDSVDAAKSSAPGPSSGPIVRPCKPANVSRISPSLIISKPKPIHGMARLQLQGLASVAPGVSHRSVYPPPPREAILWVSSYEDEIDIGEALHAVRPTPMHQLCKCVRVCVASQVVRWRG